MQASPSKARAQALESQSWSTVTSWLSDLYHPSPVPSFERNASTLKALQSLKAENVAVGRLRELVFEAQLEEFETMEKRELSGMTEDRVPELLSSLQSSLSERADVALDSLAQSAVLLGPPFSVATSASLIGVFQSQILNLTQQSLALESQIRSIKNLTLSLRAQMPQNQQQFQQQPDFTALIHSDAASSLHLDASTSMDFSTLHAQTQQHQRETKQLLLKAKEYRERIAHLERGRSRTSNTLTVSDLAAKQEQLEWKMKEVESLESAIRSFHGLPPEVHSSRVEVQRVTMELEKLKERRNEAFERIGGRT